MIPDDLRRELERVADKFRTHPEGCHHSFMLGLANHWVSVTAVQTPSDSPTGAPPRLTLLLMDSVNEARIGLSELQILRLVADWPWNEDDLSIPLWLAAPACADTARGIQHFVGLLARGLTGDVSISQYLANTCTWGRLSHFPPHGWAPLSPDPTIACMEIFPPTAVTIPVPTAEQFGRVFPRLAAVYERWFEEHARPTTPASSKFTCDDSDRLADPAFEAALRRASCVGVSAADAGESLSAESAWSRILSALIDDEGRRRAVMELLDATRHWFEYHYPPPLAHRLLDSIDLPLLRQLTPSLLDDCDSFLLALTSLAMWCQSPEATLDHLSPAESALRESVRHLDAPTSRALLRIEALRRAEAAD